MWTDGEPDQERDKKEDSRVGGVEKNRLAWEDKKWQGEKQAEAMQCSPQMRSETKIWCEKLKKGTDRT